MEKRWIKGTFCWRRIGPYENSGICDYIFNNCTKIIMDNDKSPWAHRSLAYCVDLLLMGRRWPNYLTPEGAAPTRWVYYPLRWLWIKRWTFRAQDDLTRDLYIAAIACAVHLGEFELIEYIKPPWWLYRPSTWIWRKRLIKDSTKFYIKRLRYLRALATVEHFEMNYKLWDDETV